MYDPSVKILHWFIPLSWTAFFISCTRVSSTGVGRKFLGASCHLVDLYVRNSFGCVLMPLVSHVMVTASALSVVKSSYTDLMMFVPPPVEYVSGDMVSIFEWTIEFVLPHSDIHLVSSR